MKLGLWCVLSLFPCSPLPSSSLLPMELGGVSEHSWETTGLSEVCLNSYFLSQSLNTSIYKMKKLDSLTFLL